jgi:hypothetical protein
LVDVTEENGNNHRLKGLPIACPWSANYTTKTGRHDIAEILLKVALNIKTSTATNQSNQNTIIVFDFQITPFQ